MHLAPQPLGSWGTQLISNALPPLTSQILRPKNMIQVHSYMLSSRTYFKAPQCVTNSSISCVGPAPTNQPANTAQLLKNHEACRLCAFGTPNVTVSYKADPHLRSSNDNAGCTRNITPNRPKKATFPSLRTTKTVPIHWRRRGLLRGRAQILWRYARRQSLDWRHYYPLRRLMRYGTRAVMFRRRGDRIR
jgi:hypothetical protein